MAEVKVTLSDEMVEFLRGIYETQQKLALAAEHINAASEALSNLGLRREDVAAIVASRAGVSKAAVGAAPGGPGCLRDSGHVHRG